MISMVFKVLALLCFLIGTAYRPNEPGPVYARLDLVSLGLAFWILSELLGGR